MDALYSSLYRQTGEIYSLSHTADSPLLAKVRRVALTRLYTRLTAAAGDPPDTNIIFAEYRVTLENLPKLKEEKPTKIEAKKEARKEIHFQNFGLTSILQDK